MQKFFDFNHPFFLPVWRRYATIAVCALWAVFEFVGGSPFWGTIAAGLTIITWYGLVLKFDETGARARKDKDKNA